MTDALEDSPSCVVPRISVVVPMYNAEETIEELIASYLAVADDACELVVVDDGSTDGSAALVSRAADCRGDIRLISVEHGGRSRARNRGIETARGAWVVFADADDVFLSVPLSGFLPTRDGVDVCISNFEYIPESGGREFSGATSWVCGELAVAAVLDETVLAEVPFVTDCVAFKTVWCKAFRRSFLVERHIAFDETLEMGEDNVFNVTALSRAREVELHDRPVYGYRQTNAGTTRTFRDDQTLYIERSLRLLQDAAAAHARGPIPGALRWHAFAESFGVFRRAVRYGAGASRTSRALGPLMRDPLVREGFSFAIGSGRLRGALLKARLCLAGRYGTLYRSWRAVYLSKQVVKGVLRRLGLWHRP